MGIAANVYFSPKTHDLIGNPATLNRVGITSTPLGIEVTANSATLNRRTVPCTTAAIEIDSSNYPFGEVVTSRGVLGATESIEVTGVTASITWTLSMESVVFITDVFSVVSDYELSDTLTAVSSFPEINTYTHLADNATATEELTVLSTPAATITDTAVGNEAFSYDFFTPITAAANATGTISGLTRTVSIADSVVGVETTTHSNVSIDLVEQTANASEATTPVIEALLISDAADVSEASFELTRIVELIDTAASTEVLTDTGVFTELLESTINASEVITPVIEAFLISDTADINGTISDINRIVELDDIGVAEENIITTGIFTDLVENTADLNEVITYTSEAFSFNDTANVSSIISDINRVVTVTDIATTEAIIETASVFTASFEDAVNASEGIVLGYTNTVIDIADGAETTTSLLIGNQLITDIADTSELITLSTTYTFETLDSATATEELGFAGSVYNTTVADIGYGTSNLWAKDFNAIAWVLNTQSGALTNYNNFGFTSLAFHEGKMYATSPEGLFEFGTEDDAGRGISGIYKSGFIDLGTEQKKRISDIYVGYTGGELECDVETYDAAGEVYTYNMEARDADAPRNNRLKVGRGLSSRYWRLAFRNVGGADFQIYDVAVEVAMSKRRL